MRMIIYLWELKAFLCMLWTSQFASNKESRPLFLYPASQNNITPCCNPPFLSLSSPFSLSYLPGRWSSITCGGAEGGTGDFAMQMPGNYPKARKVEAHRMKIEQPGREREGVREREKEMNWTLGSHACWCRMIGVFWGCFGWCRKKKGEREGGYKKVMRSTGMYGNHIHTYIHKSPRCVLISCICECVRAFL